MSAEYTLEIAGDTPQDPPSRSGRGRAAVLLSIKQALVTSRLTLAEKDPGTDPYNRRQGPSPGSLWARRNRG